MSAGTGRIAIPLAEHGVKMVCVEPSKPMTDSLFIKVAQKPAIHPMISILNDDPATFKIPQKFPLAFMFWSFFYIATDSERVRVLRNMGEHLEEGGLLIVDTVVGRRPEQQDHEMGRYKLGMFDYVAYWNIIRTEGSPIYKGIGRYETQLDGKLVSTSQCEFTAADVPDYAYFEGILKEAGFVVQEAFSGPDFTPYKGTPEEEYVMAVARKA